VYDLDPTTINVPTIYVNVRIAYDKQSEINFTIACCL